MSSSLPESTSPSRSKPGGNRAAGWVLIVLGAGLSVGITAIANYIYLGIHHDSLPGSPRWTGSPEFTHVTFELCAAIFAFGFVSILAGAYQVWRGRRHPLLVALVIALAAVIVYLGVML